MTCLIDFRSKNRKPAVADLKQDPQSVVDQPADMEGTK